MITRAAGIRAKLRRFRAASPSIRRCLLRNWFRRLVTRLYYRPVFGALGGGTVIYPPLLLANTEHAWLGRNVLVRAGVRMEVVLHEQSWVPRLQIGDDVNIEQNVHIVCHDSVTIAARVSIAGNCAIVDTNHPHAAFLTGKKIGDSVDSARSSVVIGENTFLGFGAVVLPNVRIGRNCMIGAGSVVTRDIPDNSVAIGIPARVVETLETNG
jgi:carbonic anhydrase/acetyltransferase-like protein (isoleucine patch superfamily)